MTLRTFFKKLTLPFVLLVSSLGVQAATYEHSLGTTEIDGVPQRVVILGQGSLDVMNKLGIKPVGLPQALLPEYLSEYKSDEYTNTGSVKEPNFETIYNLKPDLIIAEGRQTEVYKELAEIAPTYMFVIDNQDYWTTTQHHWKVLGQIFDKESEVDALIKETQQSIDHLHQEAQANPMKTLLIMNNGNKLALFGEKSRFSVVYDEFGLTAPPAPEKKATGSHGNLISFEYIANEQPELMLILDREQAIGQSSGKAKTLFANPLVDSTPAAKNKRVIFLDPNAWYLTAGGFTATQKMIADVEKAFQNAS